jgi:hypothetical protein
MNIGKNVLCGAHGRCSFEDADVSTFSCGVLAVENREAIVEVDLLAWGEPIDVLYFLEGRETESFTFFIVLVSSPSFGTTVTGVALRPFSEMHVV